MVRTNRLDGDPRKVANVDSHTHAELDAAHLLRGFMRLSDRHRVEPLVIDHGKGVWVFDEHGEPYLEAAAGMWCASFGFGEEELVEAAIAQLRRLPYYHTLTNKTVGPAVELAEKLAAWCRCRDAKVHLVASGIGSERLPR